MINIKNINLNSPEWCELIFMGKNKEYGAYELRKKFLKQTYPRPDHRRYRSNSGNDGAGFDQICNSTTCKRAGTGSDYTF